MSKFLCFLSYLGTDQSQAGDLRINAEIYKGAKNLDLFERLHREGNTIIVVTHEHDIAARAHRIISIRDGLIEKDEKIR